MGEFTKISWCDHTFNSWLGCEKVAPECDGCYAEQWAKRAGRPELWGPHGERSHTSAANWRKPILWNRWAEDAGERHRVFCASLADVFDNQAHPDWRTDLFALIRETPNLDWLLLTKRPQNIKKMIPADWGDGYLNVWLGTTAGINAAFEAQKCWTHLSAVPAVVHFISMEPLLEGISVESSCPNADWIIVGGESNQGSHRARHMEPDWARSIRDDCADLGIAFFMKQMSALAPIPPDLMIRQFPKPRPIS